ncbi:MDR family MFS transporter [Bacillus badius]|uniref:Multidrug resistance protein B n=1 Tax=Bacillus badius TaxID=1455 RepID=A0ABR5ASW5_BACBA|nr:MFS transporter [Bacillus badius]KIL75707.1 Multidrug resistance protein B [Bacillus badius]KIL77841.1 Multidrug resistance protein B [Bacillus badius]KZO01388.1 multidrug MFS transporter [Bacillus badius]KZR59189.1 multidrug MFS transporter [Bacillus badius]MED0665244.1 MFS transporter [Bacillus badius]
MPKAVWLLVIGMVINVTGASFLWPLNTIYIHGELGKSLSVAGIVLMLNAGATVVGNLLGGALFDRLGGYRTILLGAGMNLVAMAGMTMWHDWPYYVVFLTIVGFGSGVIFPAVYALVGAVWPQGGRRAFNAIYISQNAGVALGSAMGGFVASFSFNYIFAANLSMFAVFFFIAVFGYRQMANVTGAQTNVIAENGKVKSRSKLTALFILCTAYMLCWVGYVQWQSTIANYTQEVNISLRDYSLLWTINGLLIVFGQPLVNFFVRAFQDNLKKQIVIGILIFMGSFGITAFANDFKGFLAAMLILTIGEMFVWPAVPTVASQLSPKGREGFYQGIVNSTATAGRMFGPVLGGVLVDLYGMPVLFITLIAFLFISLGLTIVYDRPLKKNKEVPSPSISSL